MIAAALACAFVVLPLVAVSAAAHLQRPSFAMVTGSMAPWARPGDLVVDRIEPAARLHAGEVLTFRSPADGGRWISHRVVSVDRQGATFAVRTKGDANASVDIRVLHIPVSARVTVGTSVVRGGGTVTRWAHSSGGRELLALAVFVLVLALLWPRMPVAESHAAKPVIV